MESAYADFTSTLKDRIVIVRFLQWLGKTQRRVCADLEGEWTPVEYPTTRLMEEYFNTNIKDAAEELDGLSPEGFDDVMDELLCRESVGSNST